MKPKKSWKILTPTMWEKLRANLNPYYQIVCDAMLHSGLRPDSEFWRLTENPHWYSAGIIQLPNIPDIQKARTVCLSNEGREAMEALIAIMKSGNGRKERNTIRQALIRAASGVDTNMEGKRVPRPMVTNIEGINSEMFRRTLVAWLLACYPEKKHGIMASIGGMTGEAMAGCVGIIFERHEMTKIRKHLKGWTCKPQEMDEPKSL